MVAQALPFGLKLMESLLAESPRHRGLLLALANDFAAYAYAFVDQQADEAAAEDLDRSRALRERARHLYLRARAYGIRGLETRYPGFGDSLDRDPAAALARIRKADVPLLYWTAAAQGLAISDSKDNPEMIAQLPLVDAMIRRVLELDPDWGQGAVPEFLINIEASRVGAKPEEKQRRMREYFDRALALSGGKHASLFVSYAENASIPAQNRAEFQAMLDRALRVDAGVPENRLVNLIAQRRARWLLGRINDLFLE